MNQSTELYLSIAAVVMLAVALVAVAIAVFAPGSARAAATAWRRRRARRLVRIEIIQLGRQAQFLTNAAWAARREEQPQLAYAYLRCARSCERRAAAMETCS